MSGIAPEVWARLESSRPTGENLTARLAKPDLTDRLLCAVDVDARRHLLVPLHADDQALRDDQSRGLAVDTRELVVQGRGTGRYLEVTCLDVEGFGAFDLIGGEIADGLTRSGASPAETVRRVIAKWRRFWGQVPRPVLSREEQLGLFGELWFLSVWFFQRVGAKEAVHRWRGPFGARHDFEWPSRSVEVKTTTSTRGRVHRINGLDQLEPPEGGELFLFSLRLREEAGATNTLSSLVGSCRSQLAGDLDALSQFETALIKAGYSPAHEDEYSKLRFRILEEALFSVEADFPRLRAAQFGGGIPGGVEHVVYEINLNTFDALVVARSAADAPLP